MVAEAVPEEADLMVEEEEADLAVVEVNHLSLPISTPVQKRSVIANHTLRILPTSFPRLTLIS